MKSDIQGVAFNGNNCKKIIGPTSCETLLSMSLPDDYQLLDFVACFRALNKVVESCFGLILCPSYHTHILEFKRTFLALGLSVTPKTHIIFVHIKDFFDQMDQGAGDFQSGLGLYSEQAFEAVHHDFKMTFQKFSLNNANDKFGQKLLRAVTLYNSQKML